MIIYDLRCHQAHQFEGWFRSAEDYQQQQASGLLCCPLCDSKDVTRVPSASYVHTGKTGEMKNSQSPAKPAAASATPPAETLLQQTLAHFQQYLINNSENVGAGFAEEAKKMHYGEAEKRNIHGQASGDQLQELREDGIDVFSMPALAPEKSKLN